VKGRILATCQRALEQEVHAGRFRADLYYRLNVISFYLPPLRERKYEIADLAGGFITDLAARHGRPVQGICAEALQIMQRYTWPGNIRELRNVIERAIALCRGREIQVEDLPDALFSATAHGFGRSKPEVAAPPMTVPLRDVGAAAERARICDVLREHGDNRSRAAAALGINRRTLYKKLHRYGLRTRRSNQVSALTPQLKPR
jgi:DNA-binding NtrC family response regulator